MWLEFYSSCADEDNNKITPRVGRRYEGDEISFYCRTSLASQWYYNEAVNEPISESKELHFSDLKSYQSGKYLCYGSYSDITRHFLAATYLIIYGKKELYGFYIHSS